MRFLECLVHLFLRIGVRQLLEPGRLQRKRYRLLSRERIIRLSIRRKRPLFDAHGFA